MMYPAMAGSCSPSGAMQMYDVQTYVMKSAGTSVTT